MSTPSAVAVKQWLLAWLWKWAPRALACRPWKSKRWEISTNGQDSQTLAGPPELTEAAEGQGEVPWVGKFLLKNYVLVGDPPPSSKSSLSRQMFTFSFQRSHPVHWEAESIESGGSAWGWPNLRVQRHQGRMSHWQSLNLPLETLTLPCTAAMQICLEAAFHCPLLNLCSKPNQYIFFKPLLLH